MLSTFIQEIVSLVATLLIACIGALLIYVVVLYIVDIKQSKSSIRRNYPVIGRFRYLFEHLGTFFRQYFFALDREELPFNRAIRNWVYRACKDVTTNVAFGSTRSILTPGEPHFLSAAFPVLNTEFTESGQIQFGPYCGKPYTAPSFFNISGMSYGALSKPAVTALSKGAAQANCWLNTGEGGLSPYHLSGNADIVFQIGTAKYGVRDENGHLCDEKLKKLGNTEQVKMIELKLSQGAKPGKGGILPASKVSPEIAVIRGIKPHQPSISPNRHEEINSIDDLLKTLIRIRSVTEKPVGFKMVVGDPQWFATLCEKILLLGIENAPDFITIDGAEGGTGAAPQPLMDFVGLPLHESLPAVVDILNQFDLKKRINIIASGKLITPSSVAQALANGADAVVSARGFMMALGCIQAMQCHTNTCPTGVTTHDPDLQRGLDPTNKSNRVANYHEQIIHDVEMIAHSCGHSNAKLLNRHDIRIVGADGTSTPLNILHPNHTPAPNQVNTDIIETQELS